jgi:hypothetical protein
VGGHHTLAVTCQRLTPRDPLSVRLVDAAYAVLRDADLSDDTPPDDTPGAPALALNAADIRDRSEPFLTRGNGGVRAR